MKRIKQLRCSFCEKTETEVLKMVGGARSYICDECVAAANRIMNEPIDSECAVEQETTFWQLVVRLFGGNLRRAEG